MRKQQKRMQSGPGGFSDPFLVPTPVSLLDTGSSNPRRGVDPAQLRQEAIVLYGPPSRNNESVHLGQSLTNPNVIVLDNDDDGFEGVLDLYYGAIQGSILSMELEFAAEGDDGLMGVGWEDVSSLEVSIKPNSSAPSPFGELQESRIRTLAEYKQLVEAEKALPSPKPVAPPLGIKWSYGCCGYATGEVVNVHNKKIMRQ